MNEPSTASATAGASGYSLRGRLLWLLLSAIAGLWLLIAAAVFVRAHDIADELFDAQMAQMASSLIDASAAPDFVFQLWRIEDAAHPHHHHQREVARPATLLVHSAAAPQTPLVDHDGFSERLWGNELWRFYSVRDHDGDYQAQVGQRHDLRYALARDAAGHMLMPLLAGLPLLALAIWLAVGSALRPLSATTKAVAARRPEQLEALPIAPAPAEVLPLIDALNALFARIRRTLDSERQFTANAAHELRTPLAALKTQAQVALRAETGSRHDATADAARQHALEQVIAGVDRMTRLTEQLLTLARLDPEQTTLARIPVDLAAIAIDVCALLEPGAHARGVELSLACEALAADATRVDGVAELLGAVLRNLVDNAIRHARGAVVVSLQRAADRIELHVDDDGPGIAPAQRQQALERFERLGECGEDAAGGSGLGLSIAARICELHGGELLLGDSPRGGLRATVCLPAAGDDRERP